MWFLSARKTRRTPTSRSPRGSVRPRFEALEDRSLLSAGALDLSFGSGGLVSGPIGAPYSTTGFTLHIDSWYHVPVIVYPNTGTHPDTDNQIIAGGFVFDPATKYQDFAIARYNTDGSLDASFGTNGVAYTSVGVTSSDLFALAIDANRDILAVGAAASQRIQSGSGKNATVIDDEAFAVVRFSPAGIIDTSFNPGGSKPGTVVTNITAPVISKGTVTGGIDFADAVAIDGNSNIVVGGSSNESALYGANYGNFTLVRLTSAGSLDRSFGNSGVVVTPTFGGGGDDANALTIQPDGNILLAGQVISPGGMAVARYKGTNGSLDSSFGSGGIVSGLLPSGYAYSDAYGVLVQNNGSVVLAGTSNDSSGNGHLTLARLTSTGQKDTAFGGSQTGFYVNTNITSAFSLVQAPNGDLLTGGTHGNGSATGGLFEVSASLPDGTPDTTFGMSGTSTTPGLSGAYAHGRGIALQSDGNIVAAGFTAPSASSSTYTLALARFLPPDTKIGSFTANPNPVTANNPVTLTASNILNANPTATTTQVAFYLDANGDGILEPGSDTLLGYGTNNGGTWTFTFTPTTSGTFTLFALATDSNGVLSDPVAVSLTVQ